MYLNQTPFLLENSLHSVRIIPKEKDFHLLTNVWRLGGLLLKGFVCGSNLVCKVEIS